MSTTFGYYKAENMPRVLNNGTLAGINAVVGGFETAVLGFLTGARIGSSIALADLRVAFIIDGYSGVSTQTLKIIYNDDETFSIDGYAENARFSLTQALAAKAVASAIIAFTGVGSVSILGAVGIAAATSLVFSAIAEAVPAWYGLGFTDNLKFYDSNGNFVSGVFYPDGMDGSVQQNEHAILDFIGSAQGEIVNGGTIKIETSYFDLQFDSTFTLYNGNFTDILVGATAATSINDFLLSGDGKNLNAHAYKGIGDDYYFFKDNKVALDIPVFVNGVKTIITVNNIYDGTADATHRLVGNGSGMNLGYEYPR